MVYDNFTNGFFLPFSLAEGDGRALTLHQQNKKQMKQILIITTALTCAGTEMQAQEAPHPWSADECMAYAVSHNRDVRKSELTLSNYKANRTAATGTFLPSVTAETAAQYNFGRSINPETNTYTDVTTFYHGYSVSANLPIFDGLGRIHRLKAAKADLLMGKSALQQRQNQVALAVLQAFVDALYYEGTLAMAREKQKENNLLLRQARVLEEVGQKSHADVAQMEATAAEADVDVVKQQNLLDAAMLQLKFAMNWQEEGELTLQGLPTEQLQAGMEKASDYAITVDALPEVKQAYFAMESARQQLKSAKADLWPEISLSGGWSTTFYKTLHRTAPSYGEQLRNNGGQWVGASLSLPLFRRLSTVTGIRRARNNYLIAAENYEQKREELEKLRSEARMDAEAYCKETVSMAKKQEADSLAYTITKKQWEEGMATAIDLSATSANLLSSKAHLLQAQLMTVLKKRLVDYYNGNDIIQPSNRK